MNRFIGDKQFYKRVFAIAMPMIIQNVITNLVNLLDNVMVGQLGSEAMAGVAVVGQLVFLYNLGIFGYTSGVGILGTQYVGKGDHKGFADSFKIKVGIGIAYMLVAFSIFYFIGDKLIMAYLHDGNAGLDVAVTFGYAKEYFKVIVWGLPFFAFSQIYATTLREMRQTTIPMVSGITAVILNLIGNYILIYGNFGFPKMGVAGAALATVISRVVECAINVVWTHTHSNEAKFINKEYFNTKTSFSTIKLVLIISLPALLNELLWAGGQTMLNQCLSLRGIEAVSAVSIQSNVMYLFKSAFLAIGSTIAIMVGNALGAKDKDLAVDTDTKLITLSFVVTLVLASIVFIIAPYIPLLYNIEPEVQTIATTIIRLCAIVMPIDACINAFYNTIKAGGNPVINFLYDGGYTWIVMVPLALCIGHLTDMPIGQMFATVFFVSDGIKFIIGLILVKKRIWVKVLVD